MTPTPLHVWQFAGNAETGLGMAGPIDHDAGVVAAPAGTEAARMVREAVDGCCSVNRGDPARVAQQIARAFKVLRTACLPDTDIKAVRLAAQRVLRLAGADDGIGDDALTCSESLDIVHRVACAACDRRRAPVPLEIVGLLLDTWWHRLDDPDYGSDAVDPPLHHRWVTDDGTIVEMPPTQAIRAVLSMAENAHLYPDGRLYVGGEDDSVVAGLHDREREAAAIRHLHEVLDRHGERIDRIVANVEPDLGEAAGEQGGDPSWRERAS